MMVNDSPRAVVQNEKRGEVLYLYMAWIEDWSAPTATKRSALASVG